jgi:tetratricopeptide (TPR) repeat protein
MMVLLLSLTAGLLLPAQTAPRTDTNALLRQAIELHQKGDLQAAVPKYEAVLAANPDLAPARINLGAAYAALGRLDDAIDAYKKALPSASSNPALRLNLALAYYKRALYDDAIEQLLEVRRLQPSNRQATLLLGDSWLVLGEHKKMISLLTPIQNQSPDDRAVTYLLGTALVRDGQLAAGQRVIDRLLRDGESPEVLMLMAAMQMASANNKEALALIEKAIARNPDLPGVYTLLGQARQNDGEPALARDAFLQALQRNPSDYEANLNAGALFRMERDYPAARKHLTRARQLRPQSVALKYQFGNLEMAEGRLPQALLELEAVTRESPGFIEGHISLAQLYYRLKRKEDGDRERAIVTRLQAENQQKDASRN